MLTRSNRRGATSLDVVICIGLLLIFAWTMYRITIHSLDLMYQLTTNLVSQPFL